MALGAEQTYIVQSVRATLSNGLLVVDLVSFEQITTYVAPVALACFKLDAGFLVQDMSWAHEDSLHEFVARHACGFSKVVKLDASFLGALAESQELLVVVRHPLDASALSVGLSYRLI